MIINRIHTFWWDQNKSKTDLLLCVFTICAFRFIVVGSFIFLFIFLLINLCCECGQVSTSKVETVINVQMKRLYNRMSILDCKYVCIYIYVRTRVIPLWLSSLRQMFYCWKEEKEKTIGKKERYYDLILYVWLLLLVFISFLLLILEMCQSSSCAIFTPFIRLFMHSNETHNAVD